MADSSSGVAWPSYNTIAAAIQTTPRGTKKAIAQAVEAGLVEIAEHGTRVRSNRYRINLNVIGGEPQDTTLGGEHQFTTVVNSSSSCSERQQPYVVNHSSPESIHLSEHQAKDRKDRSQADGGSLSLRPERPSLANQPGRFAEFWLAVGKRATVGESEQLLAELIADGVDLAEIVAGANRWRMYNEATGGRRATSPLKWLQRQKWLDDWTLPKGCNTTKTRNAGAGSPKGKSREAANRQSNPQYKAQHKAWEAELSKFESAYELAGDTQSQHLSSCSVCKDAAARQAWDDICHESRRLVKAFHKARLAETKWREENPRPKRWIEK
jgi:hypothetical protein